jgi:hypothetical protein
MRQALKAALLLIAFTTFASAQSSPTEIINRSLEAIGTKQARNRIVRITAVADCVGPNGKYLTEIDSAIDSRLIFSQTRSDGTKYLGVQNGQFRWKQSGDGEFSLTDAREGYVWRSHDYQRLALEIGSRFREFAYAGQEPFGATSAVRLNAVDELGNPASVYFDQTDGKLIGFVIRNPFSQAREEIRTIFSDWRRVESVRLPMVATAIDKSGEFVLRFGVIKINGQGLGRFAVPPKVGAMSEILALHNQMRAAHFDRNADLLVDGFSQDFSDLRNGKIERPARKVSIDRFASYFQNTRFIEWDDIEPPVIKVSDDLKMAYTIVHKRVRASVTRLDGSETEVSDEFSWIATYRKVLGIWKMTAIASTRSAK